MRAQSCQVRTGFKIEKVMLEEDTIHLFSPQQPAKRNVQT